MTFPGLFIFQHCSSSSWGRWCRDSQFLCQHGYYHGVAAAQFRPTIRMRATTRMADAKGETRSAKTHDSIRRWPTASGALARRFRPLRRCCRTIPRTPPSSAPWRTPAFAPSRISARVPRHRHRLAAHHRAAAARGRGGAFAHMGYQFSTSRSPRPRQAQTSGTSSSASVPPFSRAAIWTRQDRCTALLVEEPDNATAERPGRSAARELEIYVQAVALQEAGSALVVAEISVRQPRFRDVAAHRAIRRQQELDASLPRPRPTIMPGCTAGPSSSTSSCGS